MSQTCRSTFVYGKETARGRTGGHGELTLYNTMAPTSRGTFLQNKYACGIGHETLGAWSVPIKKRVVSEKNNCGRTGGHAKHLEVTDIREYSDIYE